MKTNLHVVKKVLEAVKDEPHYAREICRSTRHGQFIVYQALKQLRNTGNLTANITENDRCMLIRHYRISEKGTQLLEALSAAESLLK